MHSCIYRYLNLDYEFRSWSPRVVTVQERAMPSSTRRCRVRKAPRSTSRPAKANRSRPSHLHPHPATPARPGPRRAMFSGLRDKLAEGVREFEASLAAPLPSSPSRTSAPALPRASSSATRGPAPASPTAQKPAAAGAGAGAGEQTASQLADSALSSLRMS